MHVETVTSSREEFDLINRETGLFSHPPDGLMIAVAWEAESPGQVTLFMVWETAEARGDFAFQHVMPLAQAGKVVSQPQRIQPIKTFVRS